MPSGNPEHLTLSIEGGDSVTALAYSAKEPRLDMTLVLAHGAGAGQTHPFIVGFARSLAVLGIDVATFNFPYMEHRRKTPDPGPVLEVCYRSVVEALKESERLGTGAMFAGGKSMGGRIASQMAARWPDLALRGLIFVGYPLHPPGRPDRLRDAHLPRVRQPMCYVQGTRDTFGTPQELEPILQHLPKATLFTVADGDHSLTVPTRSALSQ